MKIVIRSLELWHKHNHAASRRLDISEPKQERAHTTAFTCSVQQVQEDRHPVEFSFDFPRISLSWCWVACRAIAFVMLCSLSEAAEESAVKWASCFKLPELMHFGRFFSPSFLVFQGSFGLGVVGQRQRAGCFRNFSTRTYFILWILMAHMAISQLLVRHLRLSGLIHTLKVQGGWSGGCRL